MGAKSKKDDRVEAFILLHRDSHEEFDGLLRAVEAENGRVLHAVPPFAMMAFLPASSLRKIRARPSVEMAETKVIAREQPAAESPIVAEAIYVWNEHLRAQKRRKTPQRTETPLSWDAPGHLPPDLPPKEKPRGRISKFQILKPK